ncbi:MAG: ABC transporter permease [Candidatus Dojkabacteria bacterium]|jgi:ABC-2 type transport system permease protein
MKVFKNYFKIVNKHKLTVGMYFIIFAVVVFGVAQNAKEQGEKFEAYKPSIYFKNDSDSIKGKKLEEVLQDYTVFNKEVTDDTAEDELNYQTISAIVTVPENFEDNEEVKLKITPNSGTGFLVSQTIDNFLNKVSSYEKANINEEKALELAAEDIKKEVNVEYLKDQKNSDYGIQTYFNMINYTIMAQVILVVTMLMAVFNKKQIADRNNVSPISKSRFTFELTSGHLVVSFLIWLSYILVFGFMWPEAIGLTSTYMMMVNSLIFTVVVTSLAVLLSNLLKSDGAIHGVMNTISLGSSFLCGAFVPQEFINKTVLNISKIFPSYYYIRNNNLIATDSENTEIIRNTIIMLAFMIGFIAINILIKSRKKKAN